MAAVAALTRMLSAGFGLELRLNCFQNFLGLVRKMIAVFLENAP
jgi:hypothetical protein